MASLITYTDAKDERLCNSRCCKVKIGLIRSEGNVRIYFGQAFHALELSYGLRNLKKPWLLWFLDVLSLPPTPGCCMLQIRTVPALICPRLSVLLNTLTTIAWAARLGSARVVHLAMYLMNSHDSIKGHHESADCPPDVSSPIASITFIPMSVCVSVTGSLPHHSLWILAIG